jgi:hypothetical protein
VFLSHFNLRNAAGKLHQSVHPISNSYINIVEIRVELLTFHYIWYKQHTHFGMF